MGVPLVFLIKKFQAAGGARRVIEGDWWKRLALFLWREA